MTEPRQEPETADLRRAYRDLQEAGSPACPAPETLAALATGELEGDERRRVADHVVRCRSCTDSTQILMQTDAEAGGSRRAAGARTARVSGLLAAAVAFVVAAGALVWNSARRDEAVRGNAKEAPAAVTPADGSTLAQAPAEFRWPARPQAEGYRLKLFASNGDAQWEADAGKAQQLSLPEAERARLQAGKGYFWTVEVQTPLEKQKLGPYSFTLRR